MRHDARFHAVPQRWHVSCAFYFGMYECPTYVVHLEGLAVGQPDMKENYVPMDRDMMNQEGWKLSIMPGATVYDVNGDKVGTAQQYNPELDCLVVEKGILFTKDIYVPASTIESSDANGIRVSLSKDELKDERYTQPPTPGTTGMGRATNPDYPRERDLNDNLDLP